MKSVWRIKFFSCLILLFVSGSAVAADRIPVFVSIVPQQYFVKQIGKDLVDVQVMVQPGASPATYEPKPSQMVALAKAKIYFAIGVPFENAWLDKFTGLNSTMQVVHTDHGIEKLAMAAHQHGDHESDHHKVEHGHEKNESHGKAPHEEDHHDHTGLDPHVWLSPSLVKIQARNILTALQKVDPINRSVYESNYNSFMDQIDLLDADLNKILAGKKGLQFVVFHPSWGYFAHAYGLKQVSIEVEGKDPKPVQLKELIQHAREKGIKVVFVQPQFSTQSAEVIAREIGGQVVFADPLAEDWMDNLRQVADKFRQALK